MTHSQLLLNPAVQAQSRLHNMVDSWIQQQVDRESVQTCRVEALARFAVADMPNSRLEDWKYTRLAGLWKHDLVLPSVQVHSQQLSSPVDWHELGLVLTFVDGHFSQANSTLVAALPEGISFQSIIGVCDNHQDIDALHALAKASVSAEYQLVIKCNTIFNQPIIIRQIAMQANSMHSLQLQVVVEAHTSVTVIEVQQGAAQGLSLSQCSIDVAQNAQCTHLLWQDADATAYSFGWRDVTLARDARFIQRSLLLGGLVSRQQLMVTITGENAESDVATGVIAMGKQTQDMRTHTRHACMNARSKQLHRFAIGGQANGVFHGDILVEKGADKTDANMATNNLLLSPTAQANSKPQLEIYADDVRCTHGVTSGNVDEAQIFYLRARGIPAEQAKLMISAAFAQAALDDVPVEAVRVAWQQAIADKLQQALVV
jgi:Fe-S cluster assembly protein SufD